jgi:hypothetical protein
LEKSVDDNDSDFLADGYSKEDLTRDLALMVSAGILDIHMREDGEWLYSVSPRIMAMSQEERVAELTELINNHDRMISKFLEEE